MDGIVSAGGVGAVASRTQIQVAYQERVLAKQD